MAGVFVARENKVLTDILRKLHCSVYGNGWKQMQEVWEEIMDKQREMNRDVEDMFLAFLRQMKGHKKEGEFVAAGLS